MDANVSKEENLLHTRLGQFFRTIEDADEFLGTHNVYRKTLPILSVSFADEQLKPILFDAVTNKKIIKELALLPDYIDHYLAIGLINAILDKDTVDAIDTWAYETHKFDFKPDFNASEEELESQKSEFMDKLVTLRKSLIADVYNGAMMHLVNNAKARLDVSVFEAKSNDARSEYYMSIDVISSAKCRDLKDIKLLVITSDGKRFSFDAATVDTEAKYPSEEYEIALPIYTSDSVGQYFPIFIQEIDSLIVKDKYKGLSSLRVSKWAEGHMDWSTYTLSCYFPMTLDQVEEVLQPGTKLSVRFGQYDIRIDNKYSGKFYIDTLKYIEGDYTLASELSMRLPEEERNLEKKEAQKLQEKEERQQELSNRDLDCSLFKIRKGKKRELEKLEEEVKKVDFLIFDNLQNIITNPEGIKEIGAVAKFCKDNGTRSLMLEKIQKLPEKFDAQAISNGIQAEQLKVAKYNKYLRVSSILSALIVLGIITSWAYQSNSATWLIIGLVIAVYMVVKNKSFLKSFIKQPVLEGDTDKLYQEIQDIIE